MTSQIFPRMACCCTFCVVDIRWLKLFRSSGEDVTLLESLCDSYITSNFLETVSCYTLITVALNFTMLILTIRLNS